MAIEVKPAICVLRHDNHAPPASYTKRTFTSGTGNFILISNVSSITIYLSFDGVNGIAIAAGGVFTSSFSNINSYWTKGDAVGLVEVLVGSED